MERPWGTRGQHGKSSGPGGAHGLASIVETPYNLLKKRSQRREGTRTDPWETLRHSLEISQETLTLARQGLTADAARQIAGIVHRIAGVEAVAITDADIILAYEGEGCPHMSAGMPVQTRATRRVLQTGTMAVVRNKQELDCPVAGCPCPVQSAVIAPLSLDGKVVGSVKLYRSEPSEMPEYAQRLARGISELLSLQMHLAEAERQRELLTEARLEALQAQIRPHFLFNTLNTVIATSRDRPDEARELLTEFAQFLRQAISYQGDRTTVAADMHMVQAYLRLEQARFGDRLHTSVEVDARALELSIPVLTIEPLVENAVTHGLQPKDGPGHLVVRIYRGTRFLHVVVADDGVGIQPERLLTLLSGAGESVRPSLGLSNVHQRLTGLYGKRAGLRIRSRVGQGTMVVAQVPLQAHYPRWEGERP